MVKYTSHFCGSSVFVFVLLCTTMCPFYFLSSFAIILKRKRKLVALLLLYYKCIVTIIVMWLFLTVLWVGLHFLIILTYFLDHTFAELGKFTPSFHMSKAQIMTK